jgi:hypothetical protein
MQRQAVLFALVAVVFVVAVLPGPAAAETSHARIVRLSLVQGDVRFAADFHGDALTDAKATWAVAPLNLPIRQGYVLATDSGRAEVEFENGAMAFLGSNTVMEFYDLSLQDGAKVTRLVLRQGTATFYAHPAGGDYFSVTGGDFTVEVKGRAEFRLDNFDDGSTVNVELGQVAVLRNNKSTPLEKGQSLSMQAGNGKAGDVVIGRVPESDEFDRWVSGRINSVVTATNYSSQYVSSPNYTSGFADLYNYGSWFSVGGYGNCWRPFGVGLGWSPFAFGSWYSDPMLGWSFVGSAPWGWLPYHYGGWVFSPAFGWVWAPTGFGGGPIYYRPVTAVWVRSGSTIGLVPVHPADHIGKTPLNISQGVFPVEGRGIAEPVHASGGASWAVLKSAPREGLSGGLLQTPAPTRVSRTILTGESGGRPVTLSQGTSIVYDPNEHRFVNTNNGSNNRNAAVQNQAKGNEPQRSALAVPAAPGTPARAALSSPAPLRPALIPAPARTAGAGSTMHSGGATWTGSRSPGSTAGPSHTSSSHGSVGGHSR